jgi:DNA-binding Lrp family transcriptional regulator
MKSSDIIDDMDVQILRTLDEMRSRNEPYPIKAAAAALGLTQGRVRHRLFRAMHRLDGLSRFVAKQVFPTRPN